MTWTVVARKEVAYASRSRMLQSLGAVLFGLVGLVTLVVWRVAEDPSAEALASELGVPLLLIVPIASLIAGYTAIVGERRSGRLALLLGLSPTRREVLLGTFLGRSAVVAGVVVAAFALAAAFSAVAVGSVPFADLVGLGAATVLLALAFVGIAVGISAVASTRGRAMAAAVGCYLVFTLFWEVIVTGVYYAVNRQLPGVEVEPWFFALERLSPMLAYETVSNALIEGELQSVVTVDARPPEVHATPFDEQVIGEVPFYLEPWFSAVLLLAWAVLPVLIGLHRFERGDLR